MKFAILCDKIILNLILQKGIVMANRFNSPKEWNSKNKNIISYQKFPPTFLDNLSFIVRHGGYTKIDHTWNGENHNIQIAKIFYIINGVGHLEVENKHYTLESGYFYVIPEHFFHSFYIDKNDFIEKYWFHVNVNINNTDFFNISNLPICIKATDTAQAVELCKNLSDCISNMQTYKNTNEIPISLILNEKSCLSSLLCYIYKCFEKENIKLEESLEKNFGLIIKYIDRNICNNIRTEKLAELINMHPNYFISKFKNIYNQTPHQMILNKKIAKAKELLSLTELSISHIASFLGYNDVYYFSQQFKKITNLTPSQYRNIEK